VEPAAGRVEYPLSGAWGCRCTEWQMFSVAASARATRQVRGSTRSLERRLRVVPVDVRRQERKRSLVLKGSLSRRGAIGLARYMYNYTHAARRLVGDAFALWSHGTRESAAHLAGLAAECALKSILIGLGVIAPAADGQVPQAYRTHVDRAWGQFQMALQGRRGAAYLAMLPTSVMTAFDGWRVNHRYIAAGRLVPEDLERWMWAAISVSQVLDVAVNNTEAQ
jgi:hypothetical protein